MVVIGDFKYADGLLRDQVALIDLTGATATVAPWATTGYSPLCYSWAFDGYVRGVTFSPDGSYFVVNATGGGVTGHAVRRHLALRDQPQRHQCAADLGRRDRRRHGVGRHRDQHRGLRRRSQPLEQQPARLRPRAARRRAAARPGRARPGERPAVQLEPGPQPAGRRGLRGARHARRALDRLEHRLDRQPQVQAAEDRVLPVRGRLRRRRRRPRQALPGTLRRGGSHVRRRRPTSCTASTPAARPSSRSTTVPTGRPTPRDPSPYRNNGSNRPATARPEPRRQRARVDAAVDLRHRAVVTRATARRCTGRSRSPPARMSQVRLYFANRCTCTSGAGQRSVQRRPSTATTVLTNYDIVADAGDQTGDDEGRSTSRCRATATSTSTSRTSPRTR